MILIRRRMRKINKRIVNVNGCPKVKSSQPSHPFVRMGPVDLLKLIETVLKIAR
jgi:hypothetical protein